jgi:cell division protein ZapA (FtsZ GTPase activity inhibitor)
VKINELQKISVSVAGSALPLEVNLDEEEFFRIAEALLNKKVEFYEKKYSNRSRTTVLTLAAYDLTVCLLRYCNSIDGSLLAQKLRSLNEQIEDAL